MKKKIISLLEDAFDLIFLASGIWMLSEIVHLTTAFIAALYQIGLWIPATLIIALIFISIAIITNEK